MFCFSLCLILTSCLSAHPIDSFCTTPLESFHSPSSTATFLAQNLISSWPWNHLFANEHSSTLSAFQSISLPIAKWGLEYILDILIFKSLLLIRLELESSSNEIKWKLYYKTLLKLSPAYTPAYWVIFSTQVISHLKHWPFTSFISMINTFSTRNLCINILILSFPQISV